MTTAYVKAFIPIDITDARFISSTIPEPAAGEPIFVSGDIHNEFDQVSVVAANSHLLYESLINGNTGNTPATSPTAWILKSFTNRHRMFEWNNGLPSTGASPLTTVIRPGSRINAIALLGLRASTASLTVQDGIGGPVVFSLDQDLLARHAMTPYEIAFAPFVYDNVVTTFDIPPVIDPVVSMTLTDSSGSCDVGRFAVGMAADMGEVDWGTVREDENYSSITYEAGFAKFTPVPNIPVLDLPIEIDTVRVNRAHQFKEQANGKAVIWSAMTDIETLREMHVVIGPYQRFRISTLNHRLAKIDLTIKGI